MEAQISSPQTTLLILLGASAWPFSPDFHNSEAFANATRRLKAYFLNPRPFGLPAENLLDLFDSDKSADEMDVAIGQFLKLHTVAMREAGNAPRDLLLYFVGHGGFVGRNSDFYLAIRRTRMDNPRASGLQMMALADTLTEQARYLRRFIILDCCFAAAAFSAFQSGPAQVALEKTVEAFEVGHKVVGFPTKGTTLLCSSSHKSPSLLLPDGSSTMFTKALLDSLVQGTSSHQNRLTLRDVKDAAANLLQEIRNAPKPVILSPDQSEGDVADIPFFPNPRVEEKRAEQARKAEEERIRKAQQEERVRKAEEERIRKAQQEERVRRRISDSSKAFSSKALLANIRARKRISYSSKPFKHLTATILRSRTKAGLLDEGLNYYRQRKYDQALRAYEQAIDLPIVYGYEHRMKGSVLYELKRYQEALLAYEQAIHLDPDYPEAHYCKGMALERLRRPKEAQQAYARAKELGYRDKKF